MGWRATAERARWRIWQFATLGAVLATLIWARGRFALLASGEGRAACRVLVGPRELLPADCWLRRGVLGVVGADWTDPAWVGVVGVGVLGLVSLLIAGSSPRRQRSLVLMAFGWSIGMWVSFFAFGANVASSGVAGWWGVQLVAAAPAAFVATLSIAGWSQSPWTTLEAPGLRSRRRATAGRRAHVGRPVPSPTLAFGSNWPSASIPPGPIMLRWPVPAAAYLPAGARSGTHEPVRSRPPEWSKRDAARGVQRS